MLLRVGKLARARCGSRVVGAALLRTSCPHASFGAGRLLGGQPWYQGVVRTAATSSHRATTRNSLDVHDVIEWVHEERAAAITALDVKHVMGGAVGNHLVFATANTKLHMRRIAKAVVYELKERGVRVFGSSPTIEGVDSEEWMLIDAGDVRCDSNQPRSVLPCGCAERAAVTVGPSRAVGRPSRFGVSSPTAAGRRQHLHTVLQAAV